jgi:hypothetical protein
MHGERPINVSHPRQSQQNVVILFADGQKCQFLSRRLFPKLFHHKNNYKIKHMTNYQYQELSYRVSYILTYQIDV